MNAAKEAIFGPWGCGVSTPRYRRFGQGEINTSDGMRFRTLMKAPISIEEEAKHGASRGTCCGIFSLPLNHSQARDIAPQSQTWSPFFRFHLRLFPSDGEGD